MFRGMLAMMGAGPIRGSDALIGWLPAATSGRFGVGRHWNQADRKAPARPSTDNLAAGSTATWPTHVAPKTFLG